MQCTVQFIYTLISIQNCRIYIHVYTMFERQQKANCVASNNDEIMQLTAHTMCETCIMSRRQPTTTTRNEREKNNL